MRALDDFIKKVLIASGITLTSMVIIRALGLVSSIVIARLLTPSDFGAYSIIVNFAVLGSTIACLGIPVTITKYVSEWNKKDPSVARAIGTRMLSILLFSSLIVAIVCIILSDIIAVNLYGDEKLAIAIRISSLLIVTNVFATTIGSLMRGYLLISAYAKIGVIAVILTLPITLLSIFFWNLNGAIIALAISNGLIIIFSLWSMRETFKFWPKIRFSAIAERIRGNRIASFTAYSFLSGIVVIPSAWIARTMLAITWDLNSVAHFQIADSLSQIIMVIPTAVGLILMPMISEQHALEPTRINRTTSLLLNITIFLALPIGLIALPFLKPIIILLYGSQYEASYSPTIVMFAAAIFGTIGSVIFNIIVGVGRVRIAFLMNVFWMIIFILGTFLFIPSWGAEGLSTTYLLSFLSLLIIYLAYAKWRFKLRMVKTVVPLVIFISLFLIYLFLIPMTDLTISLLFSAGSCVFMIWIGFQWVLGEEERIIIWTVLRKIINRGD